ncbi:hypothetical protein [Paraburkholderia youngii]|uniref:Uncharacterized protein n=1 Tax=Paraburkholderia youngii TaxID=2782701 RepID=A0A7Y6JUK9_9BURK|nr:hypothetical protein [Paraburkholderia youngii]NUX98751.1 hypothetical protein [Paraburkholderia youngii]
MQSKKQAPVKGTVEFINAAIESIRKKGAAFDKLVQDTALDVLDHAHKHNDLDIVNRLIVAMPKGSKGQSLAVWFCKFGKLKPNDTKEKELLATKPLVWNKDAALDRAKAEATPWHSVLKDKPLIEVYDIEAKFAAFMKQVIANKDKVTNPVLLAALQNVQGVVQTAQPANASAE